MFQCWHVIMLPRGCEPVTNSTLFRLSMYINLVEPFVVTGIQKFFNPAHPNLHVSTQAYHFCPENCRCLHHRNWILLLLSVGPWGGFLSSVNGTDALKVFSRLLSVGQHHQVLLPFFTQWNSSARSCLHG